VGKSCFAGDKKEQLLVPRKNTKSYPSLSRVTRGIRTRLSTGNHLCQVSGAATGNRLVPSFTAALLITTT